jgi:hypothetical protein
MFVNPLIRALASASLSGSATATSPTLVHAVWELTLTPTVVKAASH